MSIYLISSDKKEYVHLEDEGGGYEIVYYMNLDGITEENTVISYRSKRGKELLKSLYDSRFFNMTENEKAFFLLAKGE
jgi:transcription elongation GreA/GreB family factor